jgi:hypothetical protein
MKTEEWPDHGLVGRCLNNPSKVNNPNEVAG